MESAMALRSFHCAVGPRPCAQAVLKKPWVTPIPKTPSNKPIQGHTVWGRFMSFPVDRRGSLTLNAQGSETTSTADFDAVSSKSSSQGQVEKKNLRMKTFPSGFESLILEVCDETDVAELKMKVGDFQMHLKRNIGAAVTPAPPVASPSAPPPVPSEPMDKSLAVTQAAPPSESSTAITQFSNVSPSKASMIAVLEEYGNNAYAFVKAPTVGSFQRGRTVKGTKLPPVCKEGNIIKEGQVIAYVDQFGNQVPIKSDIAGEVLKILYEEGEAVSYGDPLVAVLPSFHDIK